MHWGYTDTFGSYKWYTQFPAAAGRSQSPINIITQNVVEDPELNKTPLSFEFLDDSCETLTNTGHGWKVQIVSVEKSKYNYIDGGPLKDRYIPEQFHCHWGSGSDNGSEHFLNGQQYAAEIHIVNWNEKYSKYDNAVHKDDGICVLASLVKLGKKHDEMEKVVQRLPRIKFKGQNVDIEDVNPGNFLPKCNVYYTYLGSLTTPPCTETVKWLVFRDPIEVSEEQLTTFRSLFSYAEGEEAPPDEFGGRIIKCFRSLCPINDRIVREGKVTDEIIHGFKT